MYAKNKNDDDDVLKCILTYGRGVGPALKLPHNMEKKKIPHTKEKKGKKNQFCTTLH